MTEPLIITLDKGAARSVFPEHCAYGQKVKEMNPLKLKASGMIVNSLGDSKLDVSDEGSKKSCGTLALVDEPFIAGGQVSARHLDVWVMR